MNITSQPVKLVFTIAVSAASLLGDLSIPSAIAKPAMTNQKIVIAQAAKFNPPKPPTGSAPGGRIRGGARRSNNLIVCPKTKPDFTALVYNTQQEQDITNVWGYTTLGHPSLLFYIPFSKQSPYLTEFTLTEEDIDSTKDDGSSIYTTTIALPDKPGVISWTLPAEAPELKVGKRYRWYLSINCDQDQMSPPMYVEGVIYRVELNPTVANKLKTATLVEKFAIYAENGIWHEAIATLAELRRQNPQDKSLQNYWQSLLTDIKLEDVAEKPILGK
ncbi:MAG TPA: DUF928 domain-containing protein [Nostocaceae cyanobacterium]|nr:DUF928 domain-containing protein [Nostocaceae cyanobacterium]